MIAEFSSDDALLLAAREGSREAFGLLAMRYRDALTRYAYRYVRDRHEAGDVAQEALLRAFRHLDTFQRDRSFQTWLFVIARNAAFDVLRRRERIAAGAVPDEGIPSSAPGPEERAVRDDEARIVRCALAALPGRYREPIELYYLSGLRYRDIALVLGLPIGTVKTHIARAKQRLRNALEDVQFESVA